MMELPFERARPGTARACRPNPADEALVSYAPRLADRDAPADAATGNVRCEPAIAAFRRVVVVGPPGAGKGTQCARLAGTLGVVHISTGVLLRDLAAEGSVIGLQARAFMSRGQLVPDDLILRSLRATLAVSDRRQRGFILDGFPRTIAQGEVLLSILEPYAVDAVVALVVREETAVSRLRRRGRHDDSATAITRRLQDYEHETVPVLEWFHRHATLAYVDGDRPPDVVTGDLLHRLGVDGRGERIGNTTGGQRYA